MVVGTVIFTADGVEYIYIFGCPYLTMLVEAPSTINLNDPSRVPLCFECLKYAQTEFKHSHTDNKALLSLLSHNNNRCSVPGAISPNIRE